jgi:hypothetical protein
MLKLLGRIDMRYRLLAIPVCMLLCLLIVPEHNPVALSIAPPPPPEEVADDGSKLPDQAKMAKLAEQDPVAFLKWCLVRYQREAHAYEGVMIKHERINGKLHPAETIDFWFREEPYSVVMKWRHGARQAAAAMYVANENNGKVLVLPSILKWSGKLVERDPDGKDARANGRYTMKEFSIRQGAERTLKAWEAAKEKGTLKVEFAGIQPIEELNNRKCFKLTRTCDPPEEEGAVYVEVLVDAENWLQIGSTISDGERKLIGKYFFPELRLNPEFAANQFKDQSIRTMK